MEFGALAIALKAALCANFIAAFFLSQAYSSILWQIMALIVALATFAARQVPRDRT
jgi:hypothetical protein